jgi:hypothetical protein
MEKSHSITGHQRKTRAMPVLTSPFSNQQESMSSYRHTPARAVNRVIATTSLFNRFSFGTSDHSCDLKTEITRTPASLIDALVESTFVTCKPLNNCMYLTSNTAVREMHTLKFSSVRIPVVSARCVLVAYLLLPNYARALNRTSSQSTFAFSKTWFCPES